MSARPEATVHLIGRDGRRFTASEQRPGVVPEQLTMSATESGPDAASFVLRRPARTPWPDLNALGIVEVEVGGELVWGGQIDDLPPQGIDAIQVSAKGWHHHLDHDLIDNWYVHQNLSDWEDSRGITSDIRFRPAAEVTSSNKGIRLSFPNGSVLGANSFAGVTFDYGTKTRGPKRVRVVGSSTNNSSTYLMWVRGHDTPATLISGTVGTNQRDAFSGQSLNTLGTGFNISDDFNGGETYRYVTVLLFKSAAETAAADYAVDFTQITGYAAASYDGAISGVYYSALRASEAAKDARDDGCPLLSSSNDRITGTSFDIPELGPRGYQTPRQIIDAVNAYHNYQVGVDAKRRLIFETRSTSAQLEAGSFSGAPFNAQSLGSAADLYNKVVVTGRGPAGDEISVVRTSTVDLLDDLGVTRAFLVQARSIVTDAVANQIGDVILSEKARIPMRGSIELKGTGAVRTVAGSAPIPPAHLLTRTGELLSFNDLIDPATGAVGRSGRIKTVTYNHQAQTAAVSVDDDPSRFEAVLSRFAILNNQSD